MAISWGLFIAWSVWLAAVWFFGINQQWLGLPIGNPGNWQDAAGLVQDAPMPPNADLRWAVLALATHAELAWLALALIQVHLHVMSVNGVNTSRVWLGIAVGGAFMLAAVNHATGIPFGYLNFRPVLGAQLLNVPLGWLLLWVVLAIGSREAVLALWPKASHGKLSIAAAALVGLTMLNLHTVARDMRAWWYWHNGDLRQVIKTPWWFLPSWTLAAWFLIFLMREQSVARASAARSWRPVIVIAILNAAALLAHARHGWL